MEKYIGIQLDKNSPQHLYMQLFQKIRQLIMDGKLKEKDKLPPIRQLANMLGVNTSTIVNAYGLLEKEGFVYKKIGSGTFVSERHDNDLSDILLQKYPLDEDIRLMDRGQIQIKENMISFASATPTTDLFPVEDFKILLNEVLDRDKGDAFGYQESQGYFPLREALVNYLAQSNIQTKTENIQIISGAQQGIDVISKAFVDYNDTIIVESPTYTGAIGTFKSRGAKIVSVPILKDGIDIELLEESIKLYKPKLVYLMPNFQNPTGYSYSREKKMKIIELAKKYNLLIVEDDYLSDLSFYRDDHATLKSIDEIGSVIYIKSFSKIFMPGLRLGFLVLPKKIHHKILAAKHTSDISTSGLNQRVFDLYLKKGIWKNHIQYMEKIYKERFDIMKKCIEKYFTQTGIDYSFPQGGLNFWFSLPEGYDANKLYVEAAKNNILILPGSIFFTCQNESRCFRLSIASVYPKDIEIGIRKLSQVIEKFIKKDTDKRKGADPYTPLL
ncbi:MocR-like pyridoxine biosynthesis transcription factor PdxR [Marinisporobacter balticus]|uniref:GntR family transcriptional regulator n=1 Tax=Marinisporobacter balticus TaxID=2018667 RepID=A0A4R2L2C6_9FIRM|nr:PLP-dependent aminotransferase family protein [Marinisporobacter balticus]TCO79367.1 GntR family transcriptional regulator [Marinisporobacter balticus]